MTCKYQDCFTCPKEHRKQVTPDDERALYARSIEYSAVHLGMYTYLMRLKMTHCFRCGDHCEWMGSGAVYAKLLGFRGHPACPAESPMPKEFRDDGP